MSSSPKHRLEKLLASASRNIYIASCVAEETGLQGLTDDLLSIHVELARLHVDLAHNRVPRPIAGQIGLNLRNVSEIGRKMS